VTETESQRALYLLSDARQWRSRAEELRAVADDMSDQLCQQTARRLADDYERMARHAESHVDAAE
jgi:hypothetical protein